MDTKSTKIRAKTFVFITPLLVFWSALNTGVAATNASACESLESPRDVIDCALENHPDIRRLRADLVQGDQLEAVASQRPNPELEAKSVYGKQLGDTVTATEVNLAHTVELGGKRGARIERAQAERELLSSGSLKTKSEIFIETLKALYRLRQVQAEIHALDEALTTYTRIQSQFKRRPRLNPEQEVSYSIFQIADSDYMIKKSNLESEKAAIEKSLYISLARKFIIKPEILPPFKTDWPQLQEETNNEAKTSNSASQKIAESELKVAQAGYEFAKANSWPDIKIGPSFQHQIQGPFTFYSYGANITFPIPLFQANGAGRAYASAGVERASRHLALRKLEIGAEREILLTKYFNATNVLKSSVLVSEMERKHRNVEALFARGVVQSSLVIEAHRQIVDFTKSRGEQELLAIETLLKIYALEGRLFEERL